jgi:molybdopterin molybdotransferase
MIELETARQIILTTFQSMHNTRTLEEVSLLESHGRVIAETVFLDTPQPPFDRAMKDGYALRSIDTLQPPVQLRIVDESSAGHPGSKGIEKGQCVSIMTGAPIPPGADTVVMLEDVTLTGNHSIRILDEVKSGRNLARRGSEHLAGEEVISAGNRIDPIALGVLAAVGKRTVSVFKTPQVAILPTGDELVDLDQPTGPAQIRDSNSFTLWGQVQAAGCRPCRMGIAKDREQNLKELIKQGLESDVLLISGGVSKGKYDLVKPLLNELGVSIHFDSLKLKPGKPAVFGTYNEHYVFGLPGNPVSTFVVFGLLVNPLLSLLAGSSYNSWPVLMGVLGADVQEKPGRTKLLPVRLSRSSEGFIAVPTHYRGSADFFSLGSAHGFAMIPADVASLSAGTPVNILVYRPIDSIPCVNKAFQKTGIK